MTENLAREKASLLLPQIFETLDSLFDWKKIDLYHQFLIRENEKGGFFSKNDSALILDRHIIDCLVFVFKLKEHGFVSRETNLADVGTGPGLPGFLFLCLKESPKLTLIDSQKRKLFLLEEEVRKGNLSGANDRISFEYMRAEEEKRKFDLVTSRAVVPYPFIVEVISNLVKKGGYFCPFLGQRNFDEKTEARVLKYSGFRIKKEIELLELEFVGKRHIKILQKDSEPNLGYPRLWKDISKESKVSNG
ncbi:16S rRNA (guanine(527)-N(7))-methyltransferase RsmG [Leptospira sp. 'Mane']|uniref:16S rRNA (guanine(527)-N(7))-methyltransferase RsmG n=1 Tax=Leptospira sp. 'Mane' TaxID=3387407 RepID=UPI00398A6F71